jgi:hypothetical protein
MRFSPLVLFAAFALAASTPGCDPNQGEGETCTSNEDCSSGLTCLKGTVCCPPDPKTSSSIDCQNNGGGTATDSGSPDVADTGGGPTDTNEGGATCSVGTTCVFNADCNGCGLFCRVGHCNVECEGDRDCLSGSHCACSTHTCASGTTGGADDCRLVDAGGDADADADAPEPDTATDDTGAADTTLDDTADAAAD